MAESFIDPKREADSVNDVKQAEVHDAQDRAIELIVMNLIGFAEQDGGSGDRITFAQFIGALAGAYAEVGVDLDLRFASAIIATWCGFAGHTVPSWCIGAGIETGVTKGRMFRQITDAALVELRKHGASINDQGVKLIRVSTEKGGAA